METKKLAKISHLMPCSVVLLTAGTPKKQDVMTATCMFVSEEHPPLVVSVGKQSACHELIEQNGEFVLNIASSDQVKLAQGLGAVHGQKVDKFDKFGIVTQKASSVTPPLIKGSLASVECKVITSHPVSNSVVYLAEVVAYRTGEQSTPVAWYGNRFYKLTEEVR